MEVNIMAPDQTSIALSKLSVLKEKKIHLKRPVFFVPGWCDESCTWWKGPYKNIQGISQWITQVADNPDEVTYIDFSNETAQCNSFLDFGEVLKKKIWSVIDKNTSFDLVGHSMGGLDIRAALTQGQPLLNCHVCVTADTPHQGDNFGGAANALAKYAPHLLAKIDPITSYQVKQVKNMDPNYPPIQLINQLDNRRLFLNCVDKFFQFSGTRDWIVMDSAFMDNTGIEDICKQKVVSIPVQGCEHVGIKGITLDPRTVLAIIDMLLDIKIELGLNHGDFPGGIEIFPDENNIFI